MGRGTTREVTEVLSLANLHSLLSSWHASSKSVLLSH
jgi:hypothetical protein